MGGGGTEREMRREGEEWRTNIRRVGRRSKARVNNSSKKRRPNDDNETRQEETRKKEQNRK